MPDKYQVVRRFGYYNVIDETGAEVKRFNREGAKAKAEKHAAKLNEATEEEKAPAGRGGVGRGGRGRGGQ